MVLSLQICDVRNTVKSNFFPKAVIGFNPAIEKFAI